MWTKRTPLLEPPAGLWSALIRMPSLLLSCSSALCPRLLLARKARARIAVFISTPCLLTEKHRVVPLANKTRSTKRIQVFEQLLEVDRIAKSRFLQSLIRADWTAVAMGKVSLSKDVSDARMSGPGLVNGHLAVETAWLVERSLQSFTLNKERIDALL
mgnify:CR=1 FL=1